MNSSTKNYMCGFNGFKQINHCKKEMQSNAVKNFVEDDNFFSIPQEVSTHMKLCTWSNFWGMTDDKLTCYGYNSSQLTTNLQFNRKEKLSKMSMIAVGKYVLIHDNCHTLVIKDDAKICELTLDKNFVTLVDGTKDHVYGIK
ncbi:uncharacterized protein LOC132723942, partial [Ruditapes philippinarum]|uniref:uncharacterized protein LOC132723942 n=1 Tax=Ruditapes philippinarum TaxID=129788 RepID=UPI00295BD2A8